MYPVPDASREGIELAVTSTSDTQVFTYPAGRDAAAYGSGGDHKITGRDFTELSAHLGHITVTFGAAGITVVNLTERTFKAGTSITLDAQLAGYDLNGDGFASGVNAMNLYAAQVYLGTPIAPDANGYVVSQDLTALGVFSVNATAAAAIAAAALAGTADIPRNVVAAWTGTAVLTITGTDMDGNVIVESSASGTSLAGLKAFKTFTGISSSANITGLTVGTGNVLGIPVFLESAAHLIGELEDGAVPTAGTAVAGAQAAATATTGDVRGTYDPNSTPDGALAFELVMLTKSRKYGGAAQYGGATELDE